MIISGHNTGQVKEREKKVSRQRRWNLILIRARFDQCLVIRCLLATVSSPAATAPFQYNNESETELCREGMDSAMTINWGSI